MQLKKEKMKKILTNSINLLELVNMKAQTCDEVMDFIGEHDRVFVVEQNRDAQLRFLLVNECALDPAKLISVLHFDGSPITARYIIQEISGDIAALKAKPKKKVAP